MSSLDTPSAGRPSSSLHFVVGEMSGKLDQIMATLLPQIADLKAADKALDQRLGVVESFRWQVIGVGGFLTLVITIVTLWNGTHQYVLRLLA